MNIRPTRAAFNRDARRRGVRVIIATWFCDFLLPSGATHAVACFPRSVFIGDEKGSSRLLPNLDNSIKLQQSIIGSGRRGLASTSARLPRPREGSPRKGAIQSNAGRDSLITVGDKMPLEQVNISNPISKSEFHSRLRAWLNGSEEHIVGDPAVMGVTPWVHVQDAGIRYRLHADTRRNAVGDYLKVVDQYGDDIEWSLVENERGRKNAVAYGPDKVRITPFYFYCVDVE